MKRAAILSMVLWSLGAAGIALAEEETTDAAPAAETQAAPDDQPARTEPAETKPAEKAPEQSATVAAPTEEPAPAAAAEPSKPAEPEPAGAPAARRPRAEASLGFRDSRGARRVSRGESQDGPEDQGSVGERHRGAEEDARPRAPVFRPQGLPSRLGAGHPTGEDRLPGGASGAARGAEGPLDRSERVAEAVVRQELSGDAAEELGRDHRGGESALPRGESGDRRQGPGSVAEDPARDARRDGEEVARLAAARLPGEARNDRQDAGLGEGPTCVDGDEGPREDFEEIAGARLLERSRPDVPRGHRAVFVARARGVIPVFPVSGASLPPEPAPARVCPPS